MSNGKKIYEITDTATSFAADDYIAVAGETNGTRKILRTAVDVRAHNADAAAHGAIHGRYRFGTLLTQTTELKTGSGSTTSTANFIQGKSGTTPGSTAARTIAAGAQPISTIGSSENQKNADALHSVAFYVVSNTAPVTGVCRIGYGKTDSAPVADWSLKGYGLVFRGYAASFFRHDGTAYYETALGVAETPNVASLWAIERTTTGFLVSRNGVIFKPIAASSIGLLAAYSGFRIEVQNGTTAAECRWTASTPSEESWI